jgi:hypothetical protein
MTRRLTAVLLAVLCLLAVTGAKSCGSSGDTSAGHYSCHHLERLWDRGGGDPGQQVMAADVSLAESGGNPAAVSQTGDRGLWQISPQYWPGLASKYNLYNALQNAIAAVYVFTHGGGWGAWVTVQHGLVQYIC